MKPGLNGAVVRVREKVWDNSRAGAPAATGKPLSGAVDTLVPPNGSVAANPVQGDRGPVAERFKGAVRSKGKLRVRFRGGIGTDGSNGVGAVREDKSAHEATSLERP